MYLSAASSVEITTYTKREQEDVSNRQDNSLSNAYMRTQETEREREREREKLMIDEYTSRNLGDKI